MTNEVPHDVVHALVVLIKSAKLDFIYQEIFSRNMKGNMPTANIMRKPAT